MRPQLRAVAATQGGLFTRVQAVAAGCSERELRTMTAAHGPWVVVRRGVYLERELWDRLEPHRGQLQLRDRAVHLSMRVEHVMSHDSAARAWGIPMLRPARQLTHITRAGVLGTRTEHAVKHHMTRFALPRTVGRDGMPVTEPARTALDLAREHGLAPGVIACDHVLNRGAQPAELSEGLARMWSWPHVTRARAAVDLADAGAESIGESLLRLAVLELGIGVPETQFPVRIGRRTAWTDLRVGCHVFEFDGRQKYRLLEQGGLATRPVEDVLWDERQRQLAVCAEGLGMSRVHWDELFGQRRDETKARMLREYGVTCARFGDVLPPHLAEFARKMRGHRRSA